MVNCKGIAGPEDPKQELCRYCRTQVCEECFVTATDRDSALHSTLALPSAHRHVCLACSRLHPEEAVRSPPERPERRRHNLPRLNSAPPMTSHAPRIDSLSNMARERDRERRMQQFLAARKREQRPIGNSRTSHRESSRAGRADAPTDTPDLELSTVDLRRRRHTTAIAPTSRSCDFGSRSKGLTARDLLRANATELRPSRHVPTSYSCDFTGSTPKMAIRNAKDLELSTTDLRGAPTSYSCDFTGRTPSSTSFDEQSAETNELELSTVDLRLPKYQAKLPPPPKKGRRNDPAARSALTPISIEHLAAIDAKLSSVEHQLERCNLDNNIQGANQSERRCAKGRAKRASTADTINFTESKVATIAQEQMLTSNRSRVVEKKSVKPWGYGRSAEGSDRTAKTPTEPVDFHLSSLNLRQRRHTTTDVSPFRRDHSPRCNRDTVEKERLIPLQRKHKTEPIDFHLSTFDLTPKSNSSGASPKENQSGDDDRQTRTAKKESSPTAEVETPTYSKYATRDPCDLSYLDNFRSYTV